jgi:NAD(P)-dependent dehydrogenase (short-subunit alcohol dehydrogenase family)
MITGANSGIGRETALGLARQGATVVCVCRDRGRGEAAVAEIRAKSGNADVALMLADLSSQRSIRALAEEIRRRYDRLHVLINNAGVVIPERRLTADGLEATFALNHLGYFLLTNLLLGVLETSAPARIVNVASEASRMGTMDFDDLMFERRYGAFRAYGRSKLANIMFTYDLARRLDGTNVTVNAVHPGGVATRFGEEIGGILKPLFKLARPFMRTPEKGAETVIWLASAPELEGRTGGYYADKKPIKSARVSYDEAIRARLWRVSEELTGLARQRGEGS